MKALVTRHVLVVAPVLFALVAAFLIATAGTPGPEPVRTAPSGMSIPF